MYLKKMLTETGRKRGKLDPGMLAEGDSFGRSLALAGDFAFVGSAGHNNGQGAVFAFMKGADGYAFHSKLSNDTVEEGGFFGLNIAAEGSTLLVAAPMNGQSEDGAPNGDVFSYTYDSASDAWMDAGALQKFQAFLITPSLEWASQGRLTCRSRYATVGWWNWWCRCVLK